MTKTYKILLAIVLILGLLAIAVWFFTYRNKTPGQSQNQPPITQSTTTAKSPAFIKALINAGDVKIDFHYEGDYVSPTEWQTPEFYTPSGSTEKFLSLSKVKDRKNQFAYGPDYLSIFKSQESHSYQGTPVYLSNPKANYSASYVGFKISDRNLISEMKIEFGIDYLASTNDSATRSIGSTLASIFGINTAYACGPGIYLRPVGSSNLVFVEESNGIAWYQLEKPIALYNLSLNYCDNPDPDYCYNNMKIESLANGNLRMQILYKPNDQAGLLKIQMANLILSDKTGVYYQPTMGENFDHFYRAYLH